MEKPIVTITIPNAEDPVIVATPYTDGSDVIPSSILSDKAANMEVPDYTIEQVHPSVELKLALEQIEKMKMCGNCKHFYDWTPTM